MIKLMLGFFTNNPVNVFLPLVVDHGPREWMQDSSSLLLRAAGRRWRGSLEK